MKNIKYFINKNNREQWLNDLKQNEYLAIELTDTVKKGKKITKEYNISLTALTRQNKHLHFSKLTCY